MIWFQSWLSLYLSISALIPTNKLKFILPALSRGRQLLVLKRNTNIIESCFDTEQPWAIQVNADQLTHLWAVRGWPAGWQHHFSHCCSWPPLQSQPLATLCCPQASLWRTPPAAPSSAPSPASAPSTCGTRRTARAVSATSKYVGCLPKGVKTLKWPKFFTYMFNIKMMAGIKIKVYHS